MLILYNILLLLASVIGIPYYLLKMALTGKYRKSLIPKQYWLIYQQAAHASGFMPFRLVKLRQPNRLSRLSKREGRIYR